METLDSPEILESKPRRGFLVALSVLTFINAAARMFISIAAFLIVQAFSGSEINSETRWGYVFFYALFFSALIHITGAIIMLLRKKSGYWIYLGGHAAFLFGMLALFFSTSKDLESSNGVPFLIMLFLVVLSIANAFLYYLALGSSKTRTNLMNQKDGRQL